MATITPLTGQTTQTAQASKIETPGTDNIAKTRSTETIAPEHDGIEGVEAVQESEPVETNQAAEEEENRNTPEGGSTFIATA